MGKLGWFMPKKKKKKSPTTRNRNIPTTGDPPEEQLALLNQVVHTYIHIIVYKSPLSRIRCDGEVIQEHIFFLREH